MKRLKCVIAVLLACMLLACTAGCADREFESAAKQPPTVKYIAVDADLNLLSNFLEERDLKEDGLRSGMYFLYGTADTLYFAATSYNTLSETAVYSYDIKTRKILNVFTQSGSPDRGNGRFYLFYVSMQTEDTVTCFYSHATPTTLGAHSFSVIAQDYTLDGKQLSSRQSSSYRMYTSFSNNLEIREKVQTEWPTRRGDRYWSERSGTEPSDPERIYTLNGVTGSYDVDTMSSSDAMWSFIHSEREKAKLLSTDSIHYQPCGENAAFAVLYADETGKESYLYFNYTEGGEIKYLFKGSKKKPLLGLYVV